VWFELRRKILNGVLLPGAAISQLQIAEEMGYSQGTVREALGRLKSECLVEDSVFYSKTRVRKVDNRSIEDSLQLRAELERIAVTHAAPNLPRIKGELAPLADGFLRAVQGADIRALLEYDYEFRNIILRAASKAVLHRCWEMTRFEFNVAFRAVGGSLCLQTIHQSHIAMMNAIEAHGKKRQQLLVVHIGVLSKLLSTALIASKSDTA
jgi:DNA-binding GntR family transcriptional regulator